MQKYTFFFYSYKYVNYCNISLANTTKTKFNPLLIKQKYTILTTYHEYRYTHSKPLKGIKELNLYQLIIFQVLKLMHKTKNKAKPKTFDDSFKTINYNYPTQLSKTSFMQPKIIAKSTSFATFSMGLYI